jgi:hypothetical protein
MKPSHNERSAPTLAAAVDLEVYSRGMRDERPLVLTPGERDDLVEVPRPRTPVYLFLQN